MNIVKEPDSILHQKLTAIKAITPEIKELILAMKQKMVEANGVGLAANQVGQDLQLFVIDANLAKESNVPEVYINPEITERSADLAEMEEGCLSIPETWLQIKRAKKVRLKALDQDGNKIKIKARGFLARVLQHETDHLNGLLIKDHA